MQVSTKTMYFAHLGNDKTFEFPQTCPHCGIGNNPTTQFISSIATANGQVIGLSHKCPACKKEHMTLQEYVAKSSFMTMSLVYPNKVVADIDPLFIHYAPRFVDFYSEAVEADKLGLENIAGTGYRSAIECLIKDYALHFELDDKDYLANPKLTFNNTIDRYIKEDDLLKGALHFIKEVGNNYTHWDKDTTITLPVLRSYVDIIIQIFKSKFMLKHLPK